MRQSFSLVARGGSKIFSLAAFALLLPMAKPTYAASKTATNKAAVAKYEKKARELARKESAEGIILFKKYVDITGDGIKEAIFYFHEKNAGSSYLLKIYTYKSGKLKGLLNDGQYGLYDLYFYKKSKSFIVHGLGHGSEWYDYFKMKNGKFTRVAARSRRVNGRTWGKWIYSSKYKSKTKGIKKGKKLHYAV